MQLSRLSRYFLSLPFFSSALLLFSVLSLPFLLFYFNFFFLSHIITFSLLSLRWSSSPSNKTLQQPKPKFSDLRSICSNKQNRNQNFQARLRSACSRPRQSTVAPPGRDPHRNSFRPRPTPSPLQTETHQLGSPSSKTLQQTKPKFSDLRLAYSSKQNQNQNFQARSKSACSRPRQSPLQVETHAVSPLDQDPPVGFDENGSTEKRKKKMEERERRIEGENKKKKMEERENIRISGRVAQSG
jgi:hypothetical protein